ncbi:MAG: hypothetical protein ABI549_13305 [Flavobacterium sp.]|uniref:hypothetical protein n=1 Tax=Flavobacterium sp. TaxID=239 RepID=UPI0032666C69
MEKRTKTGGRIAGTPNKTPSETKELLRTILGKEVEKLGVMLAKLEPLERVNAIAKLLPYIIPKQIQQDISVITNETMTPEQREARIEELKKRLE